MKLPLQSCLIFIALIGAAAFGSNAPIKAQPVISVFTQTAQRQAVFNILSYPARIESRVNAVVRSEADGAVIKILKPLGSQVHRGSVVAVLQHTDPVYEYAPLSIVASVAGVVSEVNITPGSLVQKGDSIVTVTDPKQLRVLIEVAASDLSSVRAGLKGEMQIPSLQKPVTVAVLGVSPSVDPMLGVAGCELKILDQAKMHLVSGMVGRVQFKVDQRQSFLLPDFALVYQGEKTFLRVVKDGKAHKVSVTIGERQAGQVEILSGLNDGDIVINRASRFVADGAEVKVESSPNE